jgi:hypothetical protein
MSEQTSTRDWIVDNQQYLITALARVRHALARHMGRAGTAPGRDPAEIEAMMQAPPALARLAELFNLSPFERDVLLLCAGVELDASFAALCASAQADSQQGHPTFGLALAALPGAHWSALTPAAPLRHWHLVSVEPGGGLTSSPVRIDERVLHYLAGISYRDEQLAGLLQPLPEPGYLVPSHSRIAREIAATWLQAAGTSALPAVQLTGTEVDSKRAIAAAVGRLLRMDVYLLPAAAIPVDPAALDGFLRRWRREAALGNGLLLIGCDDGDRAGPGYGEEMRESAVARLVESGASEPLFVSGRERRDPWQRPVISFEVGKPEPAEQRAIWQTLLADVEPALDGQVDALVSQFNLNTPTILAAYHGALGRVADGVDGEPGSAPQELRSALWDVCRSQARLQLDDLAQRIEAVAGWDDLVLPAREIEILHEIALQVQYRSQVYEAWGFQSKSKRGLGISALFAGASGTGKTMAAEVLARELDLDLYRIDLSAVVSKYIGETEKNLRRVFDAAETGGAILLFDEADALFGKRSEVRDSHDRYANIEVSYLLQRMEAYRGLAILTTNLKEALDSAFLRRLRFVVEFPFPNSDDRDRIWRNIFPAATPTQQLDYAKLSRLDVTGGNIRNMAMHAAFLAAASGESVDMGHLAMAARHEYAKLERPLTAADTRDWVDGEGEG